MKDFKFYAPTEVVFGRESEQQIAELIRKYGGTKVLLHYGGQSAERSGLLPLIRTQLTEAGIPFVELDGVVPNPVLSKVREGIALAKAEGVDFLLPVGGGSVIDSAKAIGYGLANEGDVWDFFLGVRRPTACLPLGAVLTIPAAGSEMSDGCVITNEEGDQKRAVSSDLSRCRFAVMNPERTMTLPPHQTAAGITDIMMHTMERYFTHDTERQLTDSIAEALMRTVRHAGARLMAEPDNYALRAEIMWAGSLAHNNLTGSRGQGDWATHLIEHELSALYGVTHGAGLAAIWPHWAEYALQESPTRFAQFAVNVMGVPNDFRSAEAMARAGIAAMRAFYRQIGMPTNLPELIGRKATADEIRLMAEKCTRGATVGNLKRLAFEDVVKIYEMANGD